MPRLAWLPLAVLALFGATATVTLAGPLPDKDVARIFALLAPHADTATRQRAIREVAQARDARFIAPLVDQMRFVDSRDELLLIVDTLGALAGPEAPGASGSRESPDSSPTGSGGLRSSRRPSFTAGTRRDDTRRALALLSSTSRRFAMRYTSIARGGS